MLLFLDIFKTKERTNKLDGQCRIGKECKMAVFYVSDGCGPSIFSLSSPGRFLKTMGISAVHLQNQRNDVSFHLSHYDFYSYCCDFRNDEMIRKHNLGDHFFETMTSSRNEKYVLPGKLESDPCEFCALRLLSSYKWPYDASTKTSSFKPLCWTVEQ